MNLIGLLGEEGTDFEEMGVQLGMESLVDHHIFFTRR